MDTSSARRPLSIFNSKTVNERRDTPVSLNLAVFLKRPRKRLFLHADLADELDNDFLRRELRHAMRGAGIHELALEAVFRAVKLAEYDAGQRFRFYTNQNWAVLVELDSALPPAKGLVVEIAKRERV
jgi:hypothetical protein